MAFFECIVESIWHWYMSDESMFTEAQCWSFIRFLDENYKFFNSYGITRSLLVDKFVEHIEKIALCFLFKSPLKFESWKKEQSKLIFNSNLEMFEPFKYLLTESSRNAREIRRLSYPLKGIHWK